MGKELTGDIWKSGMMPKQILIVDDNADFIDSARLALKKRGYQILTASNGTRGLELVEKELVDLIITDVMMPEIDGFEFYKKLKINPLSVSIPVIVISIRGSMEDSFRAIGVDDFLHKPFTLEQMISKIEAVFKRTAQLELENKPELIDQSHRTILAIGNKNHVQEKMCEVTKESGYTIDTATTVAEAISKINKLTPKIIFIDIHFNEISAPELVNTLRCLPACKHKPIVGYGEIKHTVSAEGEKNLETISIITDFIHAGANQYMGPYDDYNFINILIEYSDHKVHCH